MSETTEETNLQALIRTLYEACGASKCVDDFDLRSEVPASVLKWNGLLQDQQEAFRELHAVCRRVPLEDLLDYEE